MSEVASGARSLALIAGVVLPKKPLLAPWVAVIDLGENRRQLRSADFVFTLSNPLFVTVFDRIRNLLDGRHTFDEIASLLPSIAPTTIEFLLKLLRANGVLQAAEHLDADLELSDSEHRYLAHFGDAGTFQRGLAEASVAVVGRGELASVVATTLRSTGIGVVRGPAPIASLTGPADLLLAIADSPAYGFFTEVNEHCLRLGLRWLRICAQGRELALGPTVIPHQTACFACYIGRSAAQLAESDGWVQWRTYVDSADSAGEEGMAAGIGQSLAGQATMEATRLLTGFLPPTTIGRIYRFGAGSPIPVADEVLRLPRCLRCAENRAVRAAWSQPTDQE